MTMTVAGDGNGVSLENNENVLTLNMVVAV